MSTIKKNNVIKISEWIKGAKKYFLQKFKLSDTCIAKNLTGVDVDTAKEFVEIIKPNVPNTYLRGYDV